MKTYRITGLVLIAIGISFIVFALVTYNDTLLQDTVNEGFNEIDLFFQIDQIAVKRLNIIIGYISIIGGILCLGISTIIKLIIKKEK